MKPKFRAALRAAQAISRRKTQLGRRKATQRWFKSIKEALS